MPKNENINDTNDQSENEKKQIAIIPIPEKAKNEINKIVQNNANRQLHGEAKQIFKYINYDGHWIFCTCLYQKIITGKLGEEKREKYIPYFYTNEGWKPGRPEVDHLPLYHEEKLKDNNKPVIIVANEKLANVKIDDYIILSPSAGLGNIINSVEYLKGRKIIIWPSKAEGIPLISKFLPDAEILDLKGAKKKWDILYAIENKINIKQFLENCPRVVNKEIDLEIFWTPYDIFHLIRKETYGDENLEQLDGIFYVYDENQHFWKERLEVTIKSDIQKWLEKNYIPFLKKKDIKIHTYNSNVKSFLSNYSRKYYSMNPFKETALQPYIHLQNGAIEITDQGFEFHRRFEKKESFFRDLHPLHCLDFDFEMKYYKNRNLQDYAPAFYHYLKSLIPKYVEEDKEKYERELQLTIDFFSQIIIYCLNPIKRKPRFFAMYGGQNTGKSFFIELLETIIGEEFFVARPLKHMEKQFSSSDLWGAKVYVDDDVKSNITLPDDFIKLYTGQKSITIEKKNRDAIHGVRISVAMFFISNHAFTVSGGVEGIERRLIYIPYKKKIKDPDVFLKDKITGKVEKGPESKQHKGKIFDERSAIIGLALRGLDLFIKNNNEFVMPEWISNERQEWIIQSNTITQFLHEMIYPGDEKRFTPKEIYNEYKEWCKEEDRHMYGRNNFYEKLKLEQRIEFKHTISGDIFEIELDEKDKKDWKLEDLPI